MIMYLRRTEPWRKSPISDRKTVSADERDEPRRTSVKMRCADHEGGSKPERTRRLLCGMISQERCTGSARSGGEAHLFGRRDRLLKKRWRLSGRVTSWRQKRQKTGVRVEGNLKGPQGNLLRAISRVNHCGLSNFPTNRNSD